MVKAARIIKLSKNMRPFVSRVVRNGEQQKWFAQNVGGPVTACIRSKGGYNRGVKAQEKRRIFVECGRTVKRGY